MFGWEILLLGPVWTHPELARTTQIAHFKTSEINKQTGQGKYENDHQNQFFIRDDGLYHNRSTSRNESIASD